MKKFELWQGDCLELMKNIPDGSVDLVLTDPPYGTTACKWDSVIPFEPMWEQLNRIIKPNGAICLFGTQPFTTKLISSNINNFKYLYVWEKTKACNFMHAKNMPLKLHEDICVFSNGVIAHSGKKKMPYFPQGVIEVNKVCKRPRLYDSEHGLKRPSHKTTRTISKENFPSDILKFNSVHNPPHPTQKPTDLLEYLIRTYTNEGETVLDFTAGSMSTVIACINTNRNCIAIEKDEHYFSVGCERVHNHILDNNIDLCYNQVCGGVCLWQSSKTEQVKNMVGF